jgi:hypothetical protein
MSVDDISFQGNSPGVPFVIEIWPSKHKLPIHDHGKAYTIIKVLHGKINVSYFTKLNKKFGIKLGPDIMLEKTTSSALGSTGLFKVIYIKSNIPKKLNYYSNALKNVQLSQ